MDYNKQINKLTEACQDLMNMVNELKDENTFLTDTIVNAKMGKIATERRNLLAENMNIKSDADRAVNEANAMKNEYGQKLDKIAVMIKEVQNKQNDIDGYIDSEAESKISDLKQTNSDILKKERKKLQREYQKLETDIKHKLKIHRIATAVGAGIGIIGILLGLLM